MAMNTQLVVHGHPCHLGLANPNSIFRSYTLDQPRSKIPLNDSRDTARVARIQKARATFQISVPLKTADKPGDLFMLWEIWMTTRLREHVDAKEWSEIKWRRFLNSDNILSKLSTETCLSVRGNGPSATAGIHPRPFVHG
ncbi:hypothetical protein M422DRAFT_255229 [Sphaerobolus stellatus SS14]|uniref:Uncharacterized protein n=1 Tax=Sphaerobolus stellatus (strain SS14) TaxID=990650 RepID=A0A0C9VTX0_SPHS4|nr:hypothetical protein M422DRAFT_255229 [Sphaerobolus stellatus SS14]